MSNKSWLYIVLFFVVFSFPEARGDKPPEENKKKFYEIEFTDKNCVKLTSHIHLIPPGSQLLHENMLFKDIGALQVKTDLKKDAMTSILFFEKKLKEEIPEKHIEFDMALFNVYVDFMGNHTTDMIYMIYKIQGE